MKRYSLTCPKCGDSELIFADLSSPDNLHCNSCDEDIDLDEVRGMVESWKEYLDDLDAMLKEEEKDLQKEREK